MASITKRLQYLLTQYANNTCSKSELLELLQAIEESGDDEDLQSAMDSILTNLTTVEKIINIDKQKIFNNIIRPTIAMPLYKRVWFRVSVAAAIVFLIGSVLLLENIKPKQAVLLASAEFKNDVAPGSNKAILTLANGKSISLTNVQKGQVAKQGNATITKTADGQIVYSRSVTTEPVKDEEMNLVQTPRGGKWDVTLSDGTKVWLNASSSIKYPSAFIGAERKVEITGEAYFEVAHNAAKPFKVVTKGQTVEVLGTHFNINAYDDEEIIKTTLIQGKVRITKGTKEAILYPGQQSATQFSSNLIIVKQADTDQAIAWHNGYFQFERSDVRTVMKQLSRWYDVEIKFEGKITSDTFGGSIPRDANLSQVLHTLEQSMVHFKIDGKKVTVME